MGPGVTVPTKLLNPWLGLSVLGTGGAGWGGAPAVLLGLATYGIFVLAELRLGGGSGSRLGGTPPGTEGYPCVCVCVCV